ncbi:MAG: Xaa-Pro peptidase family protein [Calditrichota bacterium]
MIIPQTELLQRVAHFQDHLKQDGVDGAVLFQRADLIYYTGAVFQGALVVPAQDEPQLFIWRGQDRIPSNFSWQVHILRNIYQFVGEIRSSIWIKWKHIGFEEDVIPFRIYRQIIKPLWPEAELVDISSAILRQRSVKSATELKLMRESGKLLAQSFQALPNLLRLGMREFEIQLAMEQILREGGSQGLIRARGFNTEPGLIAAAGASAAEPSAFDGPVGQTGMNPLAPYGSGRRVIESNVPILIDLISAKDAYVTDMSRTCVVGRLNEKFERAYRFCLDIHEEIIALLAPGAIPAELYRKALARADQAGYKEVFMNSGSNQVRFIGHGLGLELDEWPIINENTL